MKQIRYLGNSSKLISKFDEEAKDNLNIELRKLSFGIEPKDWKPMSSIGIGVNELRIHSKQKYRVIYVAKFKDAIYILHAFQKKTNKTPDKDIALAKSRFKDLANAVKRG
jgi:phage-related protein